MKITHRVRRSLAVGAAGAMVLSLLPVGAAFAGVEEICEDAPEADFDDADSIAEAQETYVNCLAAYGITVGDADGDFNPGAGTTRQNMALFIARTLSQAEDGDTDIPVDTDDEFSDIATINPAEARHAINWLESRGLVTGYDDGTFRPGVIVPRGQMATFVVRLLDELGVDIPANPDDAFSDDDGSFHEDAINALAELGIVSGFADGTFRPNIPVSRQQMAAFVIGGAGAVDDAGNWNGEFIEPVEPPVAQLNVSPTSAAVNDFSTASGANANRGARTYTVSGLDADTAYDIALFPAENITVADDGTVTFADTNSNNQADGQGATDAVIEVVNGAATSGDEVFNTSPVNGSITFVVDSTTFDEVIPVVWADETPGTANVLNLVAPTTGNANPKEAAEPFGLGGQKTWIPAEAASSADSFEGEVLFVDKEANFFVLNDTFGTETGTFRYNYEAGDTYQYDTSNTSTMAQFETALSNGDDVRGTYNQTFASTFNLIMDVPGTPTGVTASAIGDLDGDNDNHDVTLTWSAPNPPNGVITSYDLEVYDDDPAVAGCQTGTVVSTTNANNTSRTVNDLANDTYCARARAQSGTGDAGTWSAPAFFTVQKGDADTTAPTIDDLYIETDSVTTSVIDTGDTIHFDFSESMSIDTNAAVFRFTDPDGEIFDVRCADNTCSLATYTPAGSTTAITNGRLVVLLDEAPVKVGGPTPAAGAGVAQVPGTITNLSSHFDDTSGNQVDLAGSADVVIDNEF